MKKFIFLCLIIDIIGSIILIYYSITTPSKKEFENNLQSICEESYFNGQKDAAEGIWNIGVSPEGLYRWTKSPWDDGRSLIFVPNNIIASDTCVFKNMNYEIH